MVEYGTFLKHRINCELLKEKKPLSVRELVVILGLDVNTNTTRRVRYYLKQLTDTGNVTTTQERYNHIIVTKYISI